MILYVIHLLHNQNIHAKGQEDSKKTFKLSICPKTKQTKPLKPTACTVNYVKTEE
mgnify:CR=1 FL=1